MRTLKPMMLALALWVAAGCAAVQVSQDYDPDGRFPVQGTWRWRDPVQPATGDIRVDNPLLDRRIRQAVERHLAGRAFRRVEGPADLAIGYHLSIDRKIHADTHYTGLGWGGYYYPWYGGWGTETYVREIDEAQLIVDLHRVDTGELLWRGVGGYRFRTYDTPGQAAEAMQQVVDRILDAYPPP